MQQSQEQEKAEKENKADKPEKAPSTKKRKNDSEETGFIDYQGNKENKEKQPKKGPLRSKADKSKQTHKMAAEKEACVNATKDIYNTFMAAFPGTSHSKEKCKDTSQISLVEEDSDAEEKTDGETACELSFSMMTDPPTPCTSPNVAINILSTTQIMKRQQKVPPSLRQSTVMLQRIQQQMSPLVFPPHVPVIPSTGNRQERLSSTQTKSLTSRSGRTLSETAETLVQAMNSQLNGDDEYLPGGLSNFLARPLDQDAGQERKEILQLWEENSQLHDEIAMLRSQPNSSARN